MSDTLTMLELIEPGEKGDTLIEVRLTARQFASLQYVVTLAAGVPGLFAVAYAGAEGHGVGDRWAVAFQMAQARLGVALARVLSPEHATEMSALLAQIEQSQTALDNGEELPHGD